MLLTKTLQDLWLTGLPVNRRLPREMAFEYAQDIVRERRLLFHR
jgi:hypothetical protein